jgi:hypothetical protein
LWLKINQNVFLNKSCQIFKSENKFSCWCEKIKDKARRKKWKYGYQMIAAPSYVLWKMISLNSFTVKLVKRNENFIEMWRKCKSVHVNEQNRSWSQNNKYIPLQYVTSFFTISTRISPLDILFRLPSFSPVLFVKSKRPKVSIHLHHIEGTMKIYGTAKRVGA